MSGGEVGRSSEPVSHEQEDRITNEMPLIG